MQLFLQVCGVGIIKILTQYYFQTRLPHSHIKWGVNEVVHFCFLFVGGPGWMIHYTINDGGSLAEMDTQHSFYIHTPRNFSTEAGRT